MNISKGSLSFEELLSSVDGVREQVEETTVPRKMRQQRAPGKQAECKENETTVEDEFWTPNGENNNSLFIILILVMQNGVMFNLIKI